LSRKGYTPWRSYKKNIYSKERKALESLKLQTILLNGYDKWFHSIDSGGLTKRIADRNLSFLETMFDEEQFESL